MKIKPRKGDGKSDSTLYTELMIGLIEAYIIQGLLPKEEQKTPKKLYDEIIEKSNVKINKELEKIILEDISQWENKIEN